MDQHRGKLSLSHWQPLHGTAEEKRAVELRYLSLHQLHLFYEQKTVTDLEANSYSQMQKLQTAGIEGRSLRV